MAQLTERQAMDMFQKRLQEAKTLSQSRQSLPSGRQAMTYLFSEPGNVNQQRIPPIGINEKGDIGMELLKQLPLELQRLFWQRFINAYPQKQKGFQNALQMAISPNILDWIFRNRRPPIRGKAGPFQFGAGPYVNSKQGKPNIGFGFKANVPF